MLLAIDIGNSNIVFGVYKDSKLIITFRLEADHARTEDEFSALIISCLEIKDIDYKKIDGIIISSTSLSINPIFEKLATKYFNLKPIIVGPRIKTGIKVKIDEPKTLGPDILVGIVAAQQKYGANCLVIDMGTATTMTILNDKKEYIGGSIYPGLKTSITALASKTSALPFIDLNVPETLIGRDTVQAMQAGLLYGYASMIDGMIEKMNLEYGKPLQVILTGGLANRVSNLLKSEVILDEDLILDGLNYLYYKNVVKKI